MDISLEAALTGRRSVRAFAAEPPPREMVAEALRLAEFAPNAGNRQQIWRVVCADSATLARVGRTQTVLRAKFNAGKPLVVTEAELATAASAFYDAPVAVALFAPSRFHFAAADAYVYAQTLCLSALGLGLASCIVGGVGDAVGADIGRKWRVPEGYAPQCYVLLGAQRGPLPAVHPRKYPPVVWA